MPAASENWELVPKGFPAHEPSKALVERESTRSEREQANRGQPPSSSPPTTLEFATAMPLAPQAGSAPAPRVLPSPPDYFSSLSALAAYCSSPTPRNRHAAPQIPYEALAPREEVEGKGKLLVCHDYKVRGGRD